MKKHHHIIIATFLLISSAAQASYPFALCGPSSLVWAAAYGYADRVEDLILCGLADPNTPDQWGRSPLVTALRYNCCRTVCTLLERGARADQRDSKTFPLHRAIKSGCPDCVSIITDRLKQSGYVFSIDEQEKLFRRAKKTGHPFIAQLLIDRGFIDPLIVQEASLAPGKFKNLVMAAVTAKRNNVSRFQNDDENDDQPTPKRVHKEGEEEDACLICFVPLPKNKEFLLEQPRFECDHTVVCIECKKTWIKTRQAQEAHNTNPYANFAPTCPVCRAGLK